MIECPHCLTEFDRDDELAVHICPEQYESDLAEAIALEEMDED